MRRKNRSAKFPPFYGKNQTVVFLSVGLMMAAGLLRGQDLIPDTQQEIRMEHDIESAGHILHMALPATAVLTTVIVGDKEGTWQFVKSFSANLAVTYTLKYAFNKPRPEGATDGLAFPSGHTSVAFNSAVFIQKRYGWKFGIPAYILAGFVGYSRIEGLNDRHDGWDVLGGMVSGISTAYFFTSPYKPKNLDISLHSYEGHYTIGVVYKF